jgi:hypothetical protein
VGFQKFPAFLKIFALWRWSVLPRVLTTKEHALRIGTEKTYDNTYCIGKHSTMLALWHIFPALLTSCLALSISHRNLPEWRASIQNWSGCFSPSLFFWWDFPSRFADNRYYTSERQLPGYYGLTPVPFHLKQVEKVPSYPLTCQHRFQQEIHSFQLLEYQQLQVSEQCSPRTAALPVAFFVSQIVIMALFLMHTSSMG